LPPNPRRIAPRICSDLIFDRHNRITNNKFNGQNGGLFNVSAIQVAPQNISVPFSMTPGTINDNSIEGFNVGISFSAGVTGGTLSLWTICGNEFFCTVGISMSPGTTTPSWIDGVAITGNVFTYGQGGSNQPCITIAGASAVSVVGNNFNGDNAAVSPTISIGASTSNLKITDNLYNGTSQPPAASAPALPASGAGLTNNTGYVQSVSIFSGTVSSV
jgi:hypothetical protein